MNEVLLLELVRIVLRYGAMVPALLGAPSWLVDFVGAASADQQLIGLLVGGVMAATAEIGWIKAKANRAQRARRMR